MSRQLFSQLSFNAGELSPDLYGQINLAKYSSGLKTATNVDIRPHGPARKRNGFKYINEVKDSSKEVRLIPFQVTATNGFMLEFGDEYIRFYTSQAIVIHSLNFSNGTFASNITDWTDKSAGTGTISHDAGNARLDLNGGGAGNEAIAEQSLSLEQGPYTVTVDVTGGDITLNIGTTSGGTEVGTTTLNTGSNTVNISAGNAGTVYFSFENPNNDTRSIDNVVLSSTAYEINSPYSDEEVQDIQYQQFGLKMYITHPNHPIQLLEYFDTDSWSLRDAEIYPPPTLEIGYEPSTTITPGATSGTSVTFTAGASTFINGDIGRQIVNKNGTGRASITAVASGTSVTCTIVENFPSTAALTSGNWLIDTSTRGDIMLTANKTKIGDQTTISSKGAAPNLFRSSDVGSFMHVHDGIIEITEFTSATEVIGIIAKTLSKTDDTFNWTLEQPVWNASRGYPTAITFHQQRLWVGGTKEQPQTIWASVSGLFDDFGRGPNDDDALDLPIASSTVNQIQWMGSGRDLVIGTSGAELVVFSRSGPITASTAENKARTYYGSTAQQPVLIEDEVVFYQRGGRKLRTFTYNFQIDNYDGDDLIFMAEHMTEGKVIEIAHAQNPDSVIYVVLENGELLAGTYVRSQEVIGWGRYTTDGSIEHCQILTTSAGSDEVWVVANRTISGSTQRYIECMVRSTGEDWLDAHSQDSYLTYSEGYVITNVTKANPAVVTTSAAHGFSNGDSVKIINVVGMTELNNKTFTVANATSTTFELSGVNSSAYTTYVSGGEVHRVVTTISGLSHLEGKTVNVKVDGAAHPEKTVSSGSITLEGNGGIEVVVGLPYTMSLETLPAGPSSEQGPLMGQRMRRVRPLLRVRKSSKPVVNGTFVPWRRPQDAMDVAVPLYSGFIEYGPFDWDVEATITINDSTVFPVSLIGIFGTLEGNIK